MTEPPSRKPIFADPLLGDEAYLLPETAFQIFADMLEFELAETGIWELGSVQFVCNSVVAQSLLLEAEFAPLHGGATVQLSVSLEPEGWIKAVISAAPGEYAFYIERTYEEWDVWPTLSSGRGDAPGRIGKRLSWAQIEVAAWPGLHSPDGGPFATIEPAAC